MAERGAATKKTPAREKAVAAPGERTRSRGNSTILIGAQLLSVLSRLGGPAPLTRIAEAANLSPSRAYRYLRGLVDSRFIEQDPVSGRYDLGAEALHVGLAALGRIDPCRRAMAALPDLSARTQLVSSLSVWGSHGPTVLLSEHGNLISRLRMREGVVLPLLGTAAGQLFLAYMPTEATAAILAQEIAEWNESHGDDDQMSLERIAALREKIRGLGLATSFGRRDRTHLNLAAPVFDHLGRLCLTISLVGTKGTLDVSPNGAAARELKRTTEALSDRLGATRQDALAPGRAPRRVLDKV